MTSLVHEFKQGQHALPTEKCPYLYSSASWLAWSAGKFMPHKDVRSVTSGRGHTRIRVDGLLFQRDPTNGTFTQVTQ